MDAFIPPKQIKNLLTYLGSKGLINLTYSPKEGFLFEITDEGTAVVEKLNDGYYQTIKRYLPYFAPLQSASIAQINGHLQKVTNEAQK